MDLKSAKMHLWPKYGNPDFNRWWLMARTTHKFKMGQVFTLKLNFTLKVKVSHFQSPPKTIEILTKVFYTFGPNLAILAWTGLELSRGKQVIDTQTDTHTRTHTYTDAGDDNTRRPKLATGKKYCLTSDRWYYKGVQIQYMLTVKVLHPIPRFLFSFHVISYLYV